MPASIHLNIVWNLLDRVNLHKNPAAAAADIALDCNITSDLAMIRPDSIGNAVTCCRVPAYGKLPAADRDKWGGCVVIKRVSAGSEPMRHRVALSLPVDFASQIADTSHGTPFCGRLRARLARLRWIEERWLD
jgi:hypothetical protein